MRAILQLASLIFLAADVFFSLLQQPTLVMIEFFHLLSSYAVITRVDYSLIMKILKKKHFT